MPCSVWGCVSFVVSTCQPRDRVNWCGVPSVLPRLCQRSLNSKQMATGAGHERQHIAVSPALRSSDARSSTQTLNYKGPHIARPQLFDLLLRLELKAFFHRPKRHTLNHAVLE